MRTSILATSFLLAASTVAQAQRGHRVSVNGMSMYYEVSGAGAPLVVLHGAYMNIPDMGPRRCAQAESATAIERDGGGARRRRGATAEERNGGRARHAWERRGEGR